MNASLITTIDILYDSLCFQFHNLQNKLRDRRKSFLWM